MRSNHHQRSIEARDRAFPTPLAAFLWTSAGATLLSLFMAVVRTVRHGAAEGFSGLWPPFPSYDFYDHLSTFAFRHSPQFFTLPGHYWYYPAAAIFVHTPFYLLANHFHSPTVGHQAFLAVVVIVSGTLLLLFRRRMIERGLKPSHASFFCIVLIFVSWPLYVVLQRGNVEGLVWAITGIGVWAFSTNRNFLAAVLFGLAASVKIYPGVFLALFLVRPRDWRWILVGAGVATLSTLLALWYLDPNIAESWSRVSHGIWQFTQDYSKPYPNHPYDHSIFAQVHIMVGQNRFNQQHLLRAYYIIAGTIATALAFKVRNLPLSNQVLFLSCAAITLPPVSFDYTLCIVYVPLAFLTVLAVQATRKGIKVPGLLLAMILLGFVIGPTIFAMRTTIRWPPSAIKCFCSLSLIAISVLKPLSLEDQPPDAALPLAVESGG